MLIIVIVMPMSFGIVPAAQELVLVLLGDQWVSGVVLLQILAVMLPFSMGAVLPAVICESLGKLNAKLLLQITFVGFVIASIRVAYPYGIEAIAGVVVGANIIRFIAYQILMSKFIGVSFRDIVNAHIPGFKASVAVVGGIAVIRWILLDLQPALLLVSEIVVGGVVFLLSALLNPQRLLKEVMLQTISRISDGSRARGRLVNWYCTRILAG
jgi:hypothetical protein